MPTPKTQYDKCPKCGSKMRQIVVEIEEADSPVKSNQCGKCGYFDFEKKSVEKAIGEIRKKEMALKIKQKVIKLSHGRLGMYINRDVARSLNLKGGEEIYVSVPDKRRMIVDIE
jgi:predicted nucleic-acid-binding Zn-ribbon protein